MARLGGARVAGLELPYISAISPLHLRYISAISPLYLTNLTRLGGARVAGLKLNLPALQPRLRRLG